MRPRAARGQAGSPRRGQVEAAGGGRQDEDGAGCHLLQPQPQGVQYIYQLYLYIIYLSTQVSAMQQWKEFARRARSEREVVEKERQLEQVSCDWLRPVT